MTSPRKIISNTRFYIGNDSSPGLGRNYRGWFCVKEHCIMGTSMQWLGVDLCKCHALLHKAQIGLVIHPTPCLLVPTAL